MIEPREGSGVLRAAPVLAVAALGISSGAVLVRLAESPAAVTAFWRLAISAGLLAPLALLNGEWKEWKTLGARDVLAE